MALKVWLPLTKDLRQQGISSVLATNNSSVTYSSTGGKLGGCYTFSGSNSISIPEVVLPSQTPAWTFACWFKLANTTDTASCCLFSERTGGNANGYTIFIQPSNGQMIVDDGARWTVTPMAFSANTWYHLAITRNSSGKKIYVDGVLKSSTTAVGSTSSVNSNGCLIGLAQNSTSLTAGTQGFKGSMNDVRIYNHCLSLMEVKRIAQGLVVHYPLARGGFGQDNLFLNSGNSITWSGTVGSNNYTVKDFYKTVSPIPSLFVENELITVSFDWSTTATTGYFRVEAGAASPYVWGTAISSSGAGNRTSASRMYDLSSSVTSGHVRVCFKITADQTAAAETLQWLRIRKDGTSGETFTFTISNAKLERGSVETPWCPNSADSDYALFGLNSITELDCSGLHNHATRTGTFSWTSDAPKYPASTQFSSGSKISATTGMLKDANPIFTCAFWVNMPTDTYTAWRDIVTFNGSAQFRMETNASGTFLKWYNYPIGTSNGIDTNGSVSNNQWNHFVITCDGTNWKTYKNATLATTTALSGTVWTPNGTIGLGDSSGGVPMRMSDFRIYATALSADDILELYKNRHI